MARLTESKAKNEALAFPEAGTLAKLLSIFPRMRLHSRPCPPTLPPCSGRGVEITLTQAPSLCDLPVEILQHITNYLPPISAASLALSSKKICRVVGTQYWQLMRDLKPGQCGDEKFQFLCLLEKDYSLYLVCYKCNTLHLQDPLDLPRTKYKRNTTNPWPPISTRPRQHEARDCEFQNGRIALNNYVTIIDYRHLQLAMKHYRNAANFGPMSDALSHSFTDDAIPTFLRFR